VKFWSITQTVEYFEQGENYVTKSALIFSLH